MSADGTVEIRVKDLLFDAEDNPILDAETGRHLRNNIAYHYGRRSYYPGEVFRLPADVARGALAPYGNRPKIIETLEAHAAREARISARAKVQRAHDSDAIAREMALLDQQAAALSRMRQLAHERELAQLTERAPGAVTAQVMQLMDQRIAESQQREAAARGEAPPDLLRRLEMLEEQAAADRAARLAAEAELAKVKDGEPVRRGRGSGG